MFPLEIWSKTHWVASAKISGSWKPPVIPPNLKQPHTWRDGPESNHFLFKVLFVLIPVAAVIRYQNTLSTNAVRASGFTFVLNFSLMPPIHLMLVRITNLTIPNSLLYKHWLYVRCTGNLYEQKRYSTQRKRITRHRMCSCRKTFSQGTAGFLGVYATIDPIYYTNRVQPLYILYIKSATCVRFLSFFLLSFFF